MVHHLFSLTSHSPAYLMTILRHSLLYFSIPILATSSGPVIPSILSISYSWKTKNKQKQTKQNKKYFRWIDLQLPLLLGLWQYIYMRNKLQYITLHNFLIHCYKLPTVACRTGFPLKVFSCGPVDLEIFAFCKIIESIWKVCGLDTVNMNFSTWKNKSSEFSDFKLTIMVSWRTPHRVICDSTAILEQREHCNINSTVTSHPLLKWG